jgi:hypothetical protein
MYIATQYAKALFAAEKPSLKTLKEALARRGHQKLLPQIFTEYQKLMLQKERSLRFATVTPEKERTRVLFELYKKLVNNHG